MSLSINKSQPMRLDCPNLKVPIRSEPTSKGIITGYLQSGTVIEVKMKDSKGFLELADGSVSCVVIYKQLNYSYSFLIMNL